MKTVIIGRHKVEVWDSIDELPVSRFHKYNKYMLVDSGIGSDLNDFNNHVARVGKFIKTDQGQAIKELENLRQSLYMISEEISPKYLSFVTLIKSIDGKPLYDLSDENIKRISKQLSNVKVNFLNGLLEAVKKKIDTELNLYFPGQFDETAVKEYYDRLRDRVLLLLDTIIRGNDNNEEIQKIDDYLLTMAKPQVFSGKESAEIKFDKQFEEMCTFLAHRLGAEPEKMTVLQFYNAFEYLKKTTKTNGGK